LPGWGFVIQIAKFELYKYEIPVIAAAFYGTGPDRF